MFCKETSSHTYDENLTPLDFFTNFKTDFFSLINSPSINNASFYQAKIKELIHLANKLGVWIYSAHRVVLIKTPLHLQCVINDLVNPLFKIACKTDSNFAKEILNYCAQNPTYFALFTTHLSFFLGQFPSDASISFLSRQTQFEALKYFFQKTPESSIIINKLLLSATNDLNGPMISFLKAQLNGLDFRQENKSINRAHTAPTCTSDNSSQMQQSMAYEAIKFVGFRLANGSNRAKDEDKILGIRCTMKIEAMRRRVTNKIERYKDNNPSVSEASIIQKHIEFSHLALLEEEFGFCGEQTASAFTFLEAHNVYPLDLCHTTEGEHALIVIGRLPNSDPYDLSTWGNDAIVCDPWAEKVYPLAEFHRQQSVENDVRYNSYAYTVCPNIPHYLSGKLHSLYRCENSSALGQYYPPFKKTLDEKPNQSHTLVESASTLLVNSASSKLHDKTTSSPDMVSSAQTYLASVRGKYDPRFLSSLRNKLHDYQEYYGNGIDKTLATNYIKIINEELSSSTSSNLSRP